MSSFRKSIKLPWKGKRYAVLEGKENSGYAATPKCDKDCDGTNRRKSQPLQDRQNSMHFRRNTSVTQSVRDAVGTIRQRLRKSTRQRSRLQDQRHGSPITPLRRDRRTSRTRFTPPNGYREVQMYSPFCIESPRTRRQNIRTKHLWHDVETPTRLRREVEELTANMQAWVALTPRALQDRTSTRRRSAVSPLTNGSLQNRKSKGAGKTPVRRRIQTTIL